MKKICLLISVVLFNSCSNDIDEPTIKELVLANIEENALILDETFAWTAQILESQGSLEALVAPYNSRDAFITRMNNMMDGIMMEVIEIHGQSGTQFGISVMQWDTGASHHTSIQNNLKQIPVGIAGPNPGSGALELYSKEIDNRLASRQGDLTLLEHHTNRKGEQIELQSFNFGYSNPSPSVNNRLDGFVITFDRPIDVKIKVEGAIISSYSSGGFGHPTIHDYMKVNPDTEVLITMLLPAISVVRASPTPTKSSYQKFTDLVFRTQGIEERNSWDQQVRHAAFLAGFDFIISGDFNSYDEDTASIPLQHAMHHAACVLTWSKIYDLYKQ